MKVIIYQLVAIGILSIFITMQLVQLSLIDDPRRFMPMPNQEYKLPSEKISMLPVNVDVLNNIQKNPVPFSLNKSSNNTENATEINSEIIYFEDRKKYCYFYNFTVAEGLKNISLLDYEPISLALHSSINFARMIPRQSDTWDDFISYAIYMHPGSEIYLQDLKKIHYCHRKSRLKVSIHLVFAKAFLQETCPEKFPFSIPKFSENCTGINIVSILRRLFLIIPPLFAYPINVMRNAARRGAGTNLHIVADSENIFSKNFATKVRNVTQKLFNEWNDTVLVYRRFEVDKKLWPQPLELRQLQSALKENRSNYFHALIYGRGHLIPNVMGWMNFSLENEIVVANSIKYVNGAWEPQFIMRSTDPYHYEDIITRHYDHQVLVNELCRAGYKFRVLSHVYNIHSGIKRKYSDYELVMKHLAKLQAVKFAKKFTKYLREKYPNTFEMCPMFPYGGLEIPME